MRLRLPLLVVLLAAATAVSAPPASAGPTEARSPGCAAPCLLFVNFLGTGSGLVTSGDQRVNCRTACYVGTEYDERMTLTPLPDAGAVFTGWTGECESVRENQCHLWFDITKTVYAVFDRAGEPPTPLVPPVPLVPPPPAAAPSIALPESNPRGCTVFGTTGDDELVGTPGRDVICAYGGNDHIHAGRGADIVYGDGGNDRLVGGPGRDRLDGGAGRDDLRARDGVRDSVIGGPGIDSARADKRDRLRAVERSR